MINEFTVDQTDIRFEGVADSFDPETKWDDAEQAYVETGDLATSYGGEAHLLQMSISFPKVERGLKGRESAIVTVEVPKGAHEEFLKQVRGIPEGTPVVFQGGLRVRHGVSQAKKLYQTLTGKGFQAARATRPAPAQA